MTNSRETGIRRRWIAKLKARLKRRSAAKRELVDARGDVDQARRVLKRHPSAPSPDGVVPGSKAGWPTVMPTSRGGAHETGGLPGYPAFDYFASAGAPCVAPVSGRVARFSGHDPKLGAVQGAGGPLGWSVYIDGDDGRSYYLTHMGSRTCTVGQRVRQGQKIGTVADYHSFGRADHIHQGVRA